MYDERHDLIRGQHLRVTVVDVDDRGPQQLVHLTGLASHDIGETVRAQHFGLTSVPPKGAEGLLHILGGGMDRGHALGLEHPKLRPVNTPVGGTVLYDSAGNLIRLFVSKVEFAFAGVPWSVTAKGITITSNGADITIDTNGRNVKINPSGGNVYLGPNATAQVETTAGPSPTVFATP